MILHCYSNELGFWDLFYISRKRLGFRKLARGEKSIWPNLSLWMGFPAGAVGKESTCQCRRHKRCRFDSWIGKIPWRRKWQRTLVFLPGKFHGQRRRSGYSPQGCKELDMTEHMHTRARTHTHTHFILEICINCPGCDQHAGGWR